MGYFEDVVKVVVKIPGGKVATYGEVARAAGHPGSARQVAWALRDADAKGVPWHRVLGSGGRILLGGASGLRQRKLLESEGVRFLGDRVEIDRFSFRFSKRRKRAGQRL